MPPHIDELRPHLQSFDLRQLFVDGLGWNHHHGQAAHLTVDGYGYALQPLTEKAGFVVYLCDPNADGAVPSYPVRRKIEHQIAKLSYEHLIVFVDEAKTTQVWQWIKREVGKPVACREHPFRVGQRGDPLLQRLRTLAVALDEEEGLTIGVVASRVRQAMDVERLTKRFYERFRNELAAFQEFIDGIAARGDKEWYASLMLNRMMFVYFVQKQGFLDSDPDYLRNRLAMVSASSRNGNSRFHQFYRLFLLRLFHEGLGQPEAQRAPDLAALLGKVPFLNGGLFEVHDLEHNNPEISIPDEAFEKVFAFFDGYRWHLDERLDREDNEINPDVLGYIFEKYVNQKQMGAYYTKEDITGYISRNTVIPFLFDAARKECPVAFQPGGGVWRLLQDDPDRYIYPAVGHGMAWKYSPDADPERQDHENELPDEIAAGVDDVSLRDGWNNPAPEAYALPTETWREVVSRRQRYVNVRAKLVSGVIHEINDLITLNLDIERFAKDVIVQSEGPELLRAFWHAMRDVSVLDPTCGSGAFLFSALNVLEPLYSACVEGMRGFLDDLNRTKRPHHPSALKDFRDVIAQVDRHPSIRYFTLKSIVLNNLYGVDIMAEAVEICKLRLFLKLVAQLESYDQIEPLPDIDFNIRAGNTLVGFTSLEAVRRAITMEPDGQHRALYGEDHATLDRIAESAEIASRAFDQFRQQQTALGGEVTAADKAVLRSKLDALEAELNRFLAVEYQIDPQDDATYTAWRHTHQPFHWFVEFNGIMNRGGFDVIVGNPPYVEYRKIRSSYSVFGLDTVRCGNLYALVWERSIQLGSRGYMGFIVPVSAVCTDRYTPLRELLTGTGDLIISNYNDRPSKLFDGIEHGRLCIILLRKGVDTRRVFSTTYYKWRSLERDALFQRLAFVDSTSSLADFGLPKIGNLRESSMLSKFNQMPLAITHTGRGIPSGTPPIYFTRKLSYFLQILDFVPQIYDTSGSLREPSELKRIWIANRVHRDSLLGFLNSSLFYWLVTVYSDCRNLNKREIGMARFNMNDDVATQSMAVATQNLMDDIREHSQMKTMNYTAGTLTIQLTYPRLSKKLIDRLDMILAQHYGFTEEELDFIINYDIKYRMSLESS